MRNLIIPVLLPVVLGFLGTGVGRAQQQSSYLRGYHLYENHCIECHDSVVHVRENRKAQSLTEIEAFIVRWSKYRQLSWNQEDINDVLHYLNMQYYKY